MFPEINRRKKFRFVRRKFVAREQPV